MFDSSSELNTSIMNSNMDSSDDAQVLAETRGEQLQEENAALIKQNNILRAQFDQAVKLAEGMDKMHAENDNLKAQLREISNQKQDLARRLEIATRAQSEALRKCEEERASSLAQRENETKTMTKELEKTKKSFKEQIDQMYTELTALQDEKARDEIAQKTLIGRISTLLDNAVHYFNQDFNSFDEFCDFFQNQALNGFVVQPPAEMPKVEPVVIQQAVNEKEKEFMKKIKSLKMQVKASYARNKELEERLVIADKEAAKEAASHKAEVNAINAKIAQMKEEHALVDEDMKHQISVLESKIATLKADNKKPKQVAFVKEEQPKAAPIQAPVQVQVPAPVQRQQVQAQSKAAKEQERMKKEQENELIDQYLERISELTKQVETTTNKYTKACDQIKESEAKCGELLIALDKNESELNALKTVHEETCAEIETIRRALHAKEEQKDKKQEYQHRKEQQKQKATLMNLEKNVEMLKQQNYEQQLEKEEITHENKENKTKIAALEQDINDLKTENGKLHTELEDAHQRYESKKVMTEEDFIPRSAWGCGDFDPALVQALEKIGSNGSLSAASKLQHAYKAIIKFYGKKLETCEAALDESYANSQTIEATMNDFIISLTIALSDSAVTLEDFFNKKLGSQIVSDVSNMRAALTDEHRQTECLQAIVDTFVEHFGTNESDDVIAQIQAVRNEFERKNAQIAARGKKCKLLKAELGDALVKLEGIKSENKILEDELNGQIESLTASNANAQDTIKKLKSDLKATRDTLLEKETALEETEKELTEKEEILRNEIESISEEIENKHISIETQLQSDLDVANNTIANNEEQIAKYKKAVSMQKATIANRESQIASLKEENESNIKSLSARADIEKKQVVESYEKAIKDITAQCEAHRSDVEKLSGELAKSEKRVKDAKAAILKSKRDFARQEKEIKAMEEQFSREKKLTETSARNSIINAEAMYTSKLNDVKSRAEDDKRKLISIAASEFSQFFNASETIDERSYKTLIIRAKDELERLSKSDNAIRRMVSASGRQTTDDAVAQLLMDSN